MKPFTPDTLAERWGVSGKHIRDMCAKGTLSFFRVGKLYRIPFDVVEGIERCNTESKSIRASGTSSGMTGERNDAASGQQTKPQQSAPLRILRGPDNQPIVSG